MKYKLLRDFGHRKAGDILPMLGAGETICWNIPGLHDHPFYPAMFPDWFEPIEEIEPSKKHCCDCQCQT